METEQQIPEKLRELRRSRGLTVNQLAEKMDENYQKVSRMERGVTGLTLDYLLKVTNALKAPIDAVLDAPQKTIASKNEPTQATSILNKIILEVEKNEKFLFSKTSPDKKAAFISKLFDIILNISTIDKNQLVTELIDLAKVINS